jgi:NADH-quinone oxidoreductase subunit K
MYDSFISLFTGTIPLEAYIVVSLIMFFAGVYGFISRRSLLMVLISVELILNAADINFAAFNRYLYPENLEGFFFAMFTIAISACETAVAIAIVINIYRNLGNVEVESIETIQEPENNPQNLQL